MNSVKNKVELYPADTFASDGAWLRVNQAFSDIEDHDEMIYFHVKLGIEDEIR